MHIKSCLSRLALANSLPAAFEPALVFCLTHHTVLLLKGHSAIHMPPAIQSWDLANCLDGAAIHRAELPKAFMLWHSVPARNTPKSRKKLTWTSRNLAFEPEALLCSK